MGLPRNQNSGSQLKYVGDTYGKKVMVVETQYPYTTEDSDEYTNTLSSKTGDMLYDISIEGQAKHVRDVFQAVHNVGTLGIGVFYWDASWIAVGSSFDSNITKWDTYGSGWATKYASEYDSDANSSYSGGSVIDNQAMFDLSGHPLDSLNVFKYIYTGTNSSSSGGSSSSGIVSPSSANLSVGDTATFTVNNGSTISNYYFANGKCSIWSSGATTITVKARTEGQDYLNLVLSDGNTVSISITVGSSSGGSTGGGSTIDGLVSINNPASKQSTAGEWIAFGDSITYGFGVGGNDSAYPARVASASSLRANNYGETGRSVAIGASGATVPDERSFCNYYTSLPSSASLVTVFGGVNDFLLSVPMGSSSSTDKSTFYGALNVLADGLKSKYGSTRIVFFTPIRIGGHGNANGQGLTLKDYRNAIVTVCNNKGIEVLDLYSLDSMDANISVSNYMGTWDTTHPNGSGHQAIADYIVSQMLY